MNNEKREDDHKGGERKTIARVATSRSSLKTRVRVPPVQGGDVLQQEA
jgi:hypothetical protein